LRKKNDQRTCKHLRRAMNTFHTLRFFCRPFKNVSRFA
jgi:hypothetical protein